MQAMNSSQTRKVLLVAGTRPEVIKMAALYQQLGEPDAKLDSRLCITAQHRDMIRPLMSLFGMVSDYDLDIMSPNQTLNSIVAKVSQRFDEVLADYKPDWVLVQGDTTTAMSAAIASFNRGSKIGHVEAGLRTPDIFNPFPEEMNRRVIDTISSAMFAPTTRSEAELLREGYDSDRVLVTGNTVVDALHIASEIPFTFDDPELARISDSDEFMVLVTAHRRESFDGGINRICEAIQTIARRWGSGINFVLPVHPNPNVKETVHSMLGSEPNVYLSTPIDYLPFINLMKRADLILTDSGGVQEEASTFGAPILVMREVTERMESIDAGLAKLVGTDTELIVDESCKAIEGGRKKAGLGDIANPYGDGKAAERILEFISSHD